MLTPLKAVAALAIASVLYLLLWPVDMYPRAYQPPEAPELTGALAENRLLADAQRLYLPENSGSGPEDFAVLPDGIYTTAIGGGLFKVQGDALVKVADLGGRPLGLDEGPDGALYISDSFRGVMRWTPENGLEALATEIDGEPIIYANQLDVARDGTIYFSNSTDRFDPEFLGGTKPTSVMAIVEQSQAGYVARLRPDGSVEKIAEGFVYTNGVLLSPQEDFLLIADTGHAAIHRLWLKGPKEGELEPFLTSLPGYPDNIEAGDDGTFWVAFASPRASFEALMPYPFLRKVLWRLGPLVRPAAIEHGMIIQYDRDGNVLQNFQDADGVHGITTGARVIDGHIYIGMLEGTFAARYPLNGAAQ